MIIEQIQKIVPSKIKHFKKLNGGEKMYTFTNWSDDKFKFFFEFNSKDGGKKNVKRVFIKEVEKLLKKRKINDFITRADFKKYCKKTNKDGGCGFCVIVRILEFLKIGSYIAHSKGFKIINI